LHNSLLAQKYQDCRYSAVCYSELKDSTVMNQIYADGTNETPDVIETEAKGKQTQINTRDSKLPEQRSGLENFDRWIDPDGKCKYALWFLQT